MLQKIKKSYFFSDRFFSLVLVFFVSFSIFSCSFGVKKKVVKANPIVGIFESELAPIIVNILSSFGIVVSIPTAQDFLNEEKEFQEQLQMEYQKKLDFSIENKKALAQMGIQAIKQGYYVSKEFCQSVLDKWEDYRLKKNLTTKVSTCSIESMSGITSKIDDDSKTYNNFINSLLAPFNGVVITGSSFTLYYHDMFKNRNRWAEIDTFHSYTDYEACMFGSPLKCCYRIIHNNLHNGVYFDFNGRIFSFSCRVTNGLKITWGSYESKVSANKQVIDNTLNPVNEKNQGIVISPQNVEAVGKVLNPTIPDVKDSQITVDVPISDVAATSPKVVNGSDVGALPWQMGGDSIPVDKPVDNVGDSIWDKILEFLKKILIPSDNFFIDEFKALEGELNGKFNGNGLDYISDFKNNSKPVDPKFIYTFTIMGTTVTLDFSFITRIVPLCHVVFGGLTLLFLAWYHYKNVLLLIRGISPVEGGNFTGNSSGGGIDFKAMGDSAPSSPVLSDFISTSKGNSNYSTTNKYSGGGSK
ncbi:hypothetical protein [Clostridium sp.]|uniref:hypothetical protein n=1 Tax=Clostridium sp. TaxID=1506 RepID=UPI0026DC0CB9|nr:hypothetical protein [Clostridium sp.]MDO5040242.1 hypothetical protein [Clostridium sp.]